MKSTSQGEPKCNLPITFSLEKSYNLSLPIDLPLGWDRTGRLGYTKIMPEKNYLQNTIFAFLASAAWMICSTFTHAQTMLDLSQFKQEHLITQNLGADTGDISIYVSFPNWFGNAGYCPIRVRVVPRKGRIFKFSGQLQVVIGSQYYSGEGYDRRVVINVPIENGNSEAIGEVLGNFLLKNSGRFGNHFTISAKLNGRKLSGQQVIVYRGNTANANNGFKSLSLISKESSQLDSNRLDALTEMAVTGNWFSQAMCTDNVLRWGAYGDVATMPSNWLYLSSRWVHLGLLYKNPQLS